MNEEYISFVIYENYNIVAYYLDTFTGEMSAASTLTITGIQEPVPTITVTDINSMSKRITINQLQGIYNYYEISPDYTQIYDYQITDEMISFVVYESCTIKAYCTTNGGYIIGKEVNKEVTLDAVQAPTITITDVNTFSKKVTISKIAGLNTMFDIAGVIYDNYEENDDSISFIVYESCTVEAYYETEDMMHRSETEIKDIQIN